MTTPAAAALLAARDMILDPEKWCQHRSRIGAKRCAWTAVEDACGGDRGLRDSALTYLADAVDIPVPLIPHWNDTTTHDAVLIGLGDAAHLAATGVRPW